MASRAAALSLLIGCSPSPPVDPGITIQDVVLYDGSGAPGRPGSIRLVGDTIVAVGAVEPAPGDSVIDGNGLALAPGFIDTHSHHDQGIETESDALAAVSQGITTIVIGQDGGQNFPLGAWFDSLPPVGVNIASYAGHNRLRRVVLGDDFRRPARPAEVDSMVQLLRTEMGAGALGLSTGLEYDPGIYSDRAEVLSLARAAADSGGRYISHIRSEDRWFWEAIEEILAIGRAARLPVQISHLKLAMTPLWGHADSVIRILDRARAEGIDVTADVYPYPYWQSTLTVLFPNRDFDNRAEAETILREIAPADGLLLGEFDAEPALVGTTVAEIAVARGTDPATTLMSLIRESQQWARSHGGDAGESVVATSMTEADVAALLSWSHTNVSSDGALRGAHPRGFGAFPRVLGRLVREDQRLGLAEAVHKMTGLAAAHMRFRRRGELRPGWYADLVLFDPARVTDRATPANPHETSVGIEAVWVNGRLAFRDGAVTAQRSGRVIRRWDQ